MLCVLPKSPPFHGMMELQAKQRDTLAELLQVIKQAANCA
jgi:hypothetical protein